MPDFNKPFAPRDFLKVQRPLFWTCGLAFLALAVSVLMVMALWMEDSVLILAWALS